MSKSTEEKVKLEQLTEIRNSPNDILSLDYGRYKSSMYSLSLSNPATYFDMRGNISILLTEDIVTSLYNKIYLLLRQGMIGDKSVTGDRFVGYPSNKVNEMALSIAASMEVFLNDCIEIVLPANYLELSANKMIAQTNAL